MHRLLPCPIPFPSGLRDSRVLAYVCPCQLGQPVSVAKGGKLAPEGVACAEGKCFPYPPNTLPPSPFANLPPSWGGAGGEYKRHARQWYGHPRPFLAAQAAVDGRPILCFVLQFGWHWPVSQLDGPSWPLVAPERDTVASGCAAQAPELSRESPVWHGTPCPRPHTSVSQMMHEWTVCAEVDVSHLCAWSTLRNRPCPSVVGARIRNSPDPETGFGGPSGSAAACSL